MWLDDLYFRTRSWRDNNHLEISSFSTMKNKEQPWLRKARFLIDGLNHKWFHCSHTSLNQLEIHLSMLLIFCQKAIGYVNTMEMKQQNQSNKPAAKSCVFCQWPLSCNTLPVKIFPLLFHSYNCNFSLSRVDNNDNSNNGLWLHLEKRDSSLLEVK